VVAPGNGEEEDTALRAWGGGEGEGGRDSDTTRAANEYTNSIVAPQVCVCG